MDLEMPTNPVEGEDNATATPVNTQEVETEQLEPQYDADGNEIPDEEEVEIDPELKLKLSKAEAQKLKDAMLRQADYTRKTQELSQQREQVAQMLALQTALERDPRTTLAALAGVFNVDLGNQAAPVDQLSADADPLEILAREVQSLRGTLTAQQQAALAAQQQAQQQVDVQAQINREIAELKSTHGDFDQQELAAYAVENQINAPLSVVYRAWQFDKAEQTKIAEKNRIVAAKRRGQVVSGGAATTTTGAVTPGNGGGRVTAREAIMAALSGQTL